MTARLRAGMVAVVLGSVVLGAVAVFFGGDPVRSISDTFNETVVGRSETIDDWMLLLGIAGALALILGLCLGITGRRPIPVDTTRLERPPRAAGLLPLSGVALDDSATVAALRRYARITHLAGAAGVVLLAGGVTLNVHLSSGQAELLRSGSRTEGVVTSLDTSGDSEVAIVRYTVGGRTYTGELGDPDDVIDLVANQPVVVIYDPAEPARFRTERYSNTPDNLLTSGPLIAGGS